MLVDSKALVCYEASFKPSATTSLGIYLALFQVLWKITLHGEWSISACLYVRRGFCPEAIYFWMNFHYIYPLVRIRRTSLHVQKKAKRQLISPAEYCLRKGFMRALCVDLNHDKSFFCLFPWQAIRGAEAPRAASNIPDSVWPLSPRHWGPNHHLTLATAPWSPQRAKWEFYRAQVCVHTALLRARSTVTSPLTSKQKWN